MGQPITIDGMSCEHPEESVNDALTSVDGVTAPSVDRDTSTAEIEGSAATDDRLAAVEDAGYKASA